MWHFSGHMHNSLSFHTFLHFLIAISSDLNSKKTVQKIPILCKITWV
jgi:hypothetical protein